MLNWQKVFKIFLLFQFCSTGFFSVAQTTSFSLNDHWEFRQLDKGNWLPATVPGTVHTDLLANHLIPHPLLGTNEDSVQWIENCDWEYRCVFNLTDVQLAFKHLQIHFEGLDTYADIFLDNELVMQTANMFRSYDFMLPENLKVGVHQLRITFYSAVNKSHELAKQLPYTLPGGDYVFVRKAPYQFGWDWGPRLVTCGIWKSISLNCWNDWKIAAINFTQYSLNSKMAWMRCDYNLETDTNVQYLIRIVNANTHEPYTQAMMMNQEHGKGHLDFYIMNPQWWWPNGYGSQPLYQVSLEIRKLNDTSQLIMADTMSIGLRTIQLIQQPDNAGSSFYFLVNGIPMYMKGANFIPPSNFLTSVSNDDYKRIVEDAVNAQMNMLRVWGGGTYADESFYKLCDEKGILVWQDFMFAGAMYPSDSAFVNNVLAEVKENILKLRQHPCIALWCGNNEIDEAWNNWGWQDHYHYSKSDSAKIWNDYINLFQKLIPDLVVSTDGFRSYISSSPQIGWGHDEAMTTGDAHYWGVWWGNEPFNTYEKKIPRFMSEFGFQAWPNFQTAKEFTQNLNVKWDDDSLDIFKDDGLMQHQKHPTGYQTILNYLVKEYDAPKTLDEFVWKSNLLQAKGIAEAIEAQRRSKPYCMGTLYWQLNDCWPVVSWSSVDVNGNYKALQYKLKTVYNPLMISVCVQNDSLQLWVVSDLMKDSSLTVSLFNNNLKGKLKTIFSDSILMKANSSRLIFEISLYDKSFDNMELNEMIFEACLMQKDFVLQKTFHYMAPEKVLDLVNSKMDTTIIETDSSFVITLHSSVFQSGVFLDCKEAGLKFSNNYFEMDGVHDETVVIEKTISLDELKKILQIKSLNYFVDGK